MKYLGVIYQLRFRDVPVWGNSPAFVLRSVLGLSLRRLTCIQRNQKSCTDCMLKDTCVYSTFFETNIDKDAIALKGTNKATHPFVIDIISINDLEIKILVRFIGRAVNYVPYINMALERAGQLGVGKNRTKFEVEQIIFENSGLLYDMKFTDDNLLFWPSKRLQNPKALILESPCRVKNDDRYLSQISFTHLLKAINRRVIVLNELFGNHEELPSLDFENITLSENVNQQWKEDYYYSGRQGSLMKLGGIIGEIRFLAEVSETERSYIQAMELFHVGKNISFGLGKVRVEY